MKVATEEHSPTPHEVLEFLRADHALKVENDEADPLEITFDTSVHDWFDIDGFLSDVLCRIWAGNAYRLNGLFEMDAPLKEWKPILTPPRTRTVRDICEFVAPRTTVVSIPEPTILGSRCRPAGAFLLLKQMLSDVGADTTDLRPSSPLGQFADFGFPKIYSALVRTVPGLIQRTTLNYRGEAIHCVVAIVLFFATIPLGTLAFLSNLVFLPLALLCLGGFLYTWHRSEKQTEHPASVEFEGMKDFRDLSYLLAGVPPSVRGRRDRAGTEGRRA